MDIFALVGALLLVEVSGHTRFPLCDQEVDAVIGIIDIRILVFELSRVGKDKLSLKAIAEPAVY